MKNSDKPLDYRQAGVDIEAGDKLVERLKPIVARTFRKEVMSGLGGFGALFDLGQRYQNPVLVSGTDGAGTKVKLASQWQMHDGIGQDLVAMCVNDILVHGAEPLFFLDYFACGQLQVETATQVIASIAQGCYLAGCSLVGGETAEMPGLYATGDYDLAGFAVGVVERQALIDGTHIAPGDVVLGLPSSGPHANGFSLIRRLLEDLPDPANTRIPAIEKPLRDVLMEPTCIYVKPIRTLLQAVKVKGMAHITGGGLVGNVPRILPNGCCARLYRQSWPSAPLFDWLQAQGQLARDEMYRVFNQGIGYVLVLAPQDEDHARTILAASNQASYRIGDIVASESTPSVELIFS